MPPDVPPVPTPHSQEILGSYYPTDSETGTAEAVVSLFRQVAESVGTGNVAGVMHALITANATGQTPTELIADFTQEQRDAFDRGLRELNMGQGASVVAQNLLNTKVTMNGVVTSFEAAVEALIASYAASGGPYSPKNQHEFTEKYNQLLSDAKDQVKTLADRHKTTNDALMTGIQKGAFPEIPSTMTPTPEGNPQVPGLPSDSLGALVQNVAGQMTKPGNLGLPNLNQAAQPFTQPAQAVIQDLLKKLPGENGVPIEPTALNQLTKLATGNGPNSPLSAPKEAAENARDTRSVGGNPLGRGPLNASDAENARHRAQPVGESSEVDDTVEAPAATPLEPAVTAAPDSSPPVTTLSSGEASSPAEALSSPRTHLTAGDAGGPASTLTPNAAPNAAPGGGAPMTPMMGPMMGGMGAMGGGGAAPGAAGARTTSPLAYGQQPTAEAPRELLDFGDDLKGLEHATDLQLVAASLAAGLVRLHRREGLMTEVAVAVSKDAAVFVTSDGLGFLPPGMKAPANLVPLIAQVPDSFVARWLGCNQPWRPLLDAAALRFIPQPDVVVATDPDAAAQGVLVIGAKEIDAVNVSGGTQNRWEFDAIDAEDIDDVVEHLCGLWGRPSEPAASLEEQVWNARWSGDSRPDRYAPVWARYLIAAAAADRSVGDVDDARYALRSALRIPEPSVMPRGVAQ